MTGRVAGIASLTLAVLLTPATASGDDDLLFGGCADVVRQSVCERAPDAPVVFWLGPAHDAPHEFLFDGRRLDVAPHAEVDGGVRYRVVPPAHGVLTLRTGNQTALRLTMHNLPDDARWQRASAAFDARRYDEAEPHLNVLLRGSDADLRALALRMLARIALRRDELHRGQALLNAALTSAQAAGRALTAMHSAVALEFATRHAGGDIGVARTALARIAPDQRASALHRFLWAYHGSLVERSSGNVRAQQRLLEDAARVARRIGWAARELRADASLALLHIRLGQPGVAREMFDGWASQLPPDLSEYERSVFLDNLNWATLLAREQGDEVELPLSRLHDAQTLTREFAPVAEQINAHLNLAFHHLLNDEPEQAAKWLHDARMLTDAPPIDLAHWAMDLEARVAAGRGDLARAIELYDTLSIAARAAALPATSWRAQARRASVLAALGQADAAVAAHLRAEQDLDRTLVQVPLTVGRESLTAARRFAMREHLELLVDREHYKEAFELVEREQRRVLQLAHVAARVDALTPAERADWDALQTEYQQARAALARSRADGWMLSSEQLASLTRRAKLEEARLSDVLDRGLDILRNAPYRAKTPTSNPASGVTLAAWRTQRDWVVLVERDATVRAARAQCAGDAPASLAACVLAAAEPLLRERERINLLLDHDLMALDWHALPFRDGQLLDIGSVRYRSGLPNAGRGYPAPGLAVLVADPTGNLRAARREIAAVRDRLSVQRTWRHALYSGEQALAPSIVDALREASLFHYAGHASFGDEFGWDSSLQLAGDTELGVGDVLTLSQVPDVVILSGCETALRAGVDTPAMGLANAFLASGAGAVIATSRSVDDRSARAVITSFYDRWLEGNTIDDALRIAQLEVRHTSPDLDWSAFRLMMP